MTDFKRENKYLVLKWDDIEAALTGQGLDMLGSICDAIVSYREREEKPDNSYVVVNEDEPYAEQVWELIKNGGKVENG
jgi:hypothetical protein